MTQICSFKYTIAVLEHVLEPTRVVAEIARVLRPGGVVFADTPFLYPVHEGAYDFTRFTITGHRWLFRQFEELESGLSMGSGAAAFLGVRYAFIGLTRNRKMGSLLSLPLLWLSLLDRLIPAQYQVDSAAGFYFVGRKQDNPLQPRGVVTAYTGPQATT